MATIQVRDLPEETYEVIRRRARSQGRSIQSYMREWIVEMASTPTKAEGLDRIAAVAERYGEADITADEITDHVRAERR